MQHGISMSKPATLLLVLVLLAASSMIIVNPISFAKTIVVPTDYSSIQDAINAADDGDTILVKRGTYRERSLVINKTISLIGEDVSNTIIKNIDDPMSTWDGRFPPPSTVAVQISANCSKISGFTVTSTFRDVSGAFSITGNGNQLTGNLITGCMSGISVNGNYNIISQNTILEIGNYIIWCSGSYNSITENTAVGSGVEGLTVEASFNLVFGNTIIGDGWYGIKLTSGGNIIVGNNITGCTGVIIKWGSDNVICANTITNGRNAFELNRGCNNTFYANHVENNSLGARIGYDQTDISRQGGPKAVENTLYHNNFIGNTQQAIDWNWLGTNSWDDGEAGNYWSDYNGTDMEENGIGDTPYLLSEAISIYAESTTNQDRYPLMLPFDISSVNVELPEWQYTPPSQSPLPSPSPEPTPSTLPSPTPTSSQEPTSTPEQPTETIPTTLVGVACGVSVAIVGIGLLVFFKRRSRGGMVDG